MSNFVLYYFWACRDCPLLALCWVHYPFLRFYDVSLCSPDKCTDCYIDSLHMGIWPPKNVPGSPDRSISTGLVVTNSGEYKKRLFKYSVYLICHPCLTFGFSQSATRIHAHTLMYSCDWQQPLLILSFSSLCVYEPEKYYN